AIWGGESRLFLWRGNADEDAAARESGWRHSLKEVINGNLASRTLRRTGSAGAKQASGNHRASLTVLNPGGFQDGGGRH
ncbi:hypothetical protein, partial [Lonsdalea populi]|uniref:hypothetical protein n=1 Tax=Lonsdalea populi TaxID=1172565 RepID=UPI001C65ABC6